MIEALAFVLGGLWRRWFGGWGPPAGRSITLPVGFGLGVALFWLASWEPVTTLVLAGAVTLAMIPAHGPWMDLGRIKPTRREFLDPALDWLGLTGYWRDFTGLALRYSLFSVPIGVGMVLAGFGWAVIPAGVGVALVYAAAWLVYDAGYLDCPTCVGELGIGALFFGTVALAL